MLDITSQWVRSGSTDFDVIMASTVDPDWALAHRPVVSTRNGHTLYTKSRLCEPEGKVVLCPLRCEALLHHDLNPKATLIKFTCTNCGSNCNIKSTKPSKTTRLGRRGLIKVDYPQVQLPAQWNIPLSGSSTEQGKGETSLNPAAAAITEGCRPARVLPSRSLRIGSATPS